MVERKAVEISEATVSGFSKSRPGGLTTVDSACGRISRLDLEKDFVCDLFKKEENQRG